MTAQRYPSYDSYPTDNSEMRFKQAGKLLKGLFALMLPALALLYVSTRFDIRIFFLTALWLNLFLIGCAGIVVVISGILGVHEKRKYEKLANPNTHPDPRKKFTF